MMVNPDDLGGVSHARSTASVVSADARIQPGRASGDGGSTLPTTKLQTKDAP